MGKRYLKIALLLIVGLCFAVVSATAQDGKIVVGAERLSDYLPLLEGRRVGVLTNHTGMVSERTHLVDTLVSHGIDVRLIFAPEHGFRGDMAAGELVPSGFDAYTGIEVLSLYGKNRSPRANDVFGCDVIVVDIQDVGVRYYTYISTLYLMMQTCADVGVDVLVLDRPNPNGMYVDGPILDMQYRSFVGILPIPVVHGMTIGEMARMINGMGWLEQGRRCSLTVVPCLGYSRSMRYELPVPPSPNLPNMQAIYLYPSLCYLEATDVSVGRGTDFPFQTYGHPDFESCDFGFTPTPRRGAHKPKLQMQQCNGVDLRSIPQDSIIARGLDLSYFMDAFERRGRSADFLTPYFESLIGVGYVRDMLYGGASEAEIRATWADDVELFMQQRAPYLIYD